MFLIITQMCIYIYIHTVKLIPLKTIRLIKKKPIQLNAINLINSTTAHHHRCCTCAACWKNQLVFFFINRVWLETTTRENTPKTSLLASDVWVYKTHISIYIIYTCIFYKMVMSRIITKTRYYQLSSFMSLL